MKVLVTGGNGFIGSVLVRTMLADGYQVRCMVRSTSDTRRVDGLPIDRVLGDARDPQALARATHGCGAIVHLAGLSSWKEINSPLMQQVVVEGTRNMLQVATSMRPMPPVVYVSSVLAVNGSKSPRVFDETAEFTLRDPGLEYSRCKRAAEQLCREAFEKHGLAVVIINPGEVYGPNDHDLITAGNLIDFAKSDPVLVCDGGTSIVYVDDVALGIVRALERGRPGERYILGGENLTVKQLAQLWLRMLGSAFERKRRVQMPNGLLRAVNATALALHIPLPYDPHVIPYATRYWFMNNGKATRELGVAFRSAEETLGPTLAWLRKEARI